MFSTCACRVYILHFMFVIGSSLICVNCLSSIANLAFAHCDESLSQDISIRSKSEIMQDNEGEESGKSPTLSTTNSPAYSESVNSTEPIKSVKDNFSIPRQNFVLGRSVVNFSQMYNTSFNHVFSNGWPSTTNVPAKQEDNLTMLWWVQLSWTSVFALMILIAIGGNCIVMWIVIAHKTMRTVTNYFLVNLSCADLLLSTLNCFFNFIYMLQGNWQFGSWYCRVNNFIANTTVAASVFTLTAMSCDRHLAIVHPLHPRMSKVTAIIVIVMIWILSMTLASPCMLFSTTVTYRYGNYERTGCILIWPDGQPTDSQMDFAYQILFLVITYIVPMVLMSFCYTSIGRVLWGSKSIGERTQMQLDAIRSKRKIVKMIIFIVFFFGLCWLPYHVYFIYTHFDRSILYSRYIQHVYLAFYWFAMANAMVNPLIYYWMNARFRGYFRRAIFFWRANLPNPGYDCNLDAGKFKSTRYFEEDDNMVSLRHLRHHGSTTTILPSPR